ncbi:hypothetical protein BC628DRAFT_1543573 [Trametes gibbosa]|nr:hypothetical protein BC628DRAFT_1543573 [Trametes gibbosa]
MATSSQTADSATPASTAPSQTGNPRKRQRVEEDTTSDNQALAVVSQPRYKFASNSPKGLVNEVTAVPTPVTGELSAAMRVISALKLIACQWSSPFEPIGDCPTAYGAQVQEMISYGPEGLEPAEDAEGDPQRRKNNEKDAARVQRNEERFVQLSGIAKEIAKDHAHGFLNAPFDLRITRAGCEFDGPIKRNTKAEEPWPSSKTERKAHKQKRVRLKTWYKQASISGYGDVKAQVTRIDKRVRAAREILASEFSVEDELLRRIERIWTERFVYGPRVRAEPYKIHLYGPGDHFKSHRDTPQKDLVGTFLVGLGDSADSGSLVVVGEEMPAHAGSWCAFYPDVPHEVTTIVEGHRAVIAFKLFRAPVASDAAPSDYEAEKTREIRAKVTQIVGEVEAPYGVLLQHKYTLNTDTFNGFDAILAEAIQAEAAQLASVSVHHMPVVVTASSHWGSHDDDRWKDYAMHCSTQVYAFTSGHIDALIDRSSSQGHGKISHASCGCPWLDGIDNVPFHTADLSDSTMFPYQKEFEETCNYVGNEAQAWRADSVYLSFALLVLPEPAEVGSGTTAEAASATESSDGWDSKYGSEGYTDEGSEGQSDEGSEGQSDEGSEGLSDEELDSQSETSEAEL